LSAKPAIFRTTTRLGVDDGTEVNAVGQMLFFECVRPGHKGCQIRSLGRQNLLVVCNIEEFTLTGTFDDL